MISPQPKGKTRKQLHARQDRDAAKVRKAVRAQKVEQAQQACEACGKWTGDWGHAHHRVPRSRGGLWTVENIEYLCAQCHQDRHRKGCHEQERQ